MSEWSFSFVGVLGTSPFTKIAANFFEVWNHFDLLWRWFWCECGRNHSDLLLNRFWCETSWNYFGLLLKWFWCKTGWNHSLFLLKWFWCKTSSNHSYLLLKGFWCKTSWNHSHLLLKWFWCKLAEIISTSGRKSFLAIVEQLVQFILSFRFFAARFWPRFL